MDCLDIYFQSAMSLRHFEVDRIDHEEEIVTTFASQTKPGHGSGHALSLITSFKKPGKESESYFYCEN